MSPRPLHTYDHRIAGPICIDANASSAITKRKSAARHFPAVCGFTLVEMLAVMGVIVILLALIAPPVISLMRGSQMNQGTDFLMSQLELARQTALSRNRSVQFRVCCPTGGQFTSTMQLFVTPVTNANGTVVLNTDGSVKMNYTQIGKPASLPSAIIIDAGPNLSTILHPAGITPATATATDPRLGSQGTNYQYVAFQFKPDGSTDLVSQTPPSNSGTTNANSLWFLTIHNATDGDSLQTPPSNYCTFQIDPYNGHVQEFRP